MYRSAASERRIPCRPACAFVRNEGEQLPFQDASFDKMVAVNSVYVWPEPAALLREIHRVHKRGGLAAITFAHKEFMQRLPFVGARFRLHDNVDFSALADRTPFSLEWIYEETEEVQAKNADVVMRTFSVGLLRKA